MLVQSPEILFGLGHVPPDLLFQRFDGRKLDLVAQAIEEVKFNFGFRREFKRMEIQQVGLDGKRVAAESRAVPDVGDRVEALILIAAAEAGAGDIDAVFGDEFFVARQVDSGYGVLRSVAAASAGGGENAERTRQQVACPAHLAFGKQLADVAAKPAPRAGASRDNRGPQIPFPGPDRAAFECCPPPCARSGSCSLRGLPGHAGASSGFHGQTGAASSAKDRAKTGATGPSRSRWLPAGAVFPEAESAVSGCDRDAGCGRDGARR